MEEKGKRAKFFETRYFGFVIGLLVILIFLFVSLLPTFPEYLETKMLDVNFQFKNIRQKINQSRQAGVTQILAPLNISPDIRLIGIDTRTLSRLGRWPFPRSMEARFINRFTRITDQSQRENSIFLDIFFNEPSNAINDWLLINSIKENGRIFLETVLDRVGKSVKETVEASQRQEVLYKKYGEIKHIKGNWQALPVNLDADAPLKPYGKVLRGYGHANYYPDFDKVFRRQVMVARTSLLVEAYRLSQLTPDLVIDQDNFEHLGWFDVDGNHHAIPYPLTAVILEKLKKQMAKQAPQIKTVDEQNREVINYAVFKFENHFVPSITLSLALEYFHKTLDDIEVQVGEHILIPAPMQYDSEQQQLQPYSIMTQRAVYEQQEQEDKASPQKLRLKTAAKFRTLKQIKIPIDNMCRMAINYMGPASNPLSKPDQVFDYKSFLGYVSREIPPDPSTWPRSAAAKNKIIMVGAFSMGMAADVKPTPLGLMYGVEIHANSLNTILMDQFISSSPFWINLIVLLALVMIVAFMASRTSTIFALIGTLLIIGIFFIAVTTVFDLNYQQIDFSTPALAMIFTFITIVIYRGMTEERDKKRIKATFGKFVSPDVVTHLLDHPPELGGVDKELSVLFSDIRGFTTLSETMTPQELVNHLNIYLTTMTDIILDFKGTLDKYVGDEIMSFWGAPFPLEDHALLACKCALKQMEALQVMNQQWPPERRIDIGIGINSGIMTVGNMGSPGRMNYTLTGDNVNLGARLEGTNKIYKTHIIISENTYALVKENVIVRELDNIRVKGKHKPVVIYELVDCPGGLEPPKKINKKQ